MFSHLMPFFYRTRAVQLVNDIVREHSQEQAKSIADLLIANRDKKRFGSAGDKTGQDVMDAIYSFQKYLQCPKDRGSKEYYLGWIPRIVKGPVKGTPIDILLREKIEVDAHFRKILIDELEAHARIPATQEEIKDAIEKIKELIEKNDKRWPSGIKNIKQISEKIQYGNGLVLAGFPIDSDFFLHIDQGDIWALTGYFDGRYKAYRRKFHSEKLGNEKIPFNNKMTFTNNRGRSYVMVYLGSDFDHFGREFYKNMNDKYLNSVSENVAADNDFPKKPRLPFNYAVGRNSRAQLVKTFQEKGYASEGLQRPSLLR